jgi:hypothetical protein
MNRWLVLALGSSLSLACGLRGAQADEISAGNWQKHEYNFRVLGFTSTYSCDGLADKLRALLLAAGARADARSTGGACSRGYGNPDKFASAKLTFYTLSPGEPQGQVAITGSWRAVEFTGRRPRELDLGDCELMDQFRQSVLPLFSVRNLVNQVSCIPNQASGSVINLKFESFQADKGKK